MRIPYASAFLNYVALENWTTGNIFPQKTRPTQTKTAKLTSSNLLVRVVISARHDYATAGNSKQLCQRLPMPWMRSLLAGADLSCFWCRTLQESCNHRVRSIRVASVPIHPRVREIQTSCV